MLAVIIGTFILLSVFIGVTWCTKRYHQKRLMMSKQKTRRLAPDVDNALGVYLHEQIQAEDKGSFNDIGGCKVSNTEQIELDLAKNSEGFTLNTEVSSIIANNDKAKVEQSVRVIKRVEQTKSKDWDIVLTLTILPEKSVPFRGEDVKAALNLADLELGKMHLYHRHLAGNPLQPMFSVTNILSPGTLKPNELAVMEVKGLNIFMCLPNPTSGLLAFDAMLDAADKIAKQLQGGLCDEKRQTLTQATLESMRSQILNFNLMKEGDNH